MRESMVRQRQGKVQRAVVPFIINIAEGINFSSKLSLLQKFTKRVTFVV